MRIDASKAIGAYAAAMTLGCAWLLLGGQVAPAGAARFTVLDAERINIREADGTLRLAIANRARLPGITVHGREYPHPNRTEAGMIFFNDQGDENGGLIVDGRLRDGMPSNGGSLTFDRWHQDQTLQLVSTEQGRERRAGLVVTDRPEAPLDYAMLARFATLPPAQRAAYVATQQAATARRAWLGRSEDGVSSLELRDAGGHVRLRLSAPASGAARIELLDAAGKVTRSIE